MIIKQNNFLLRSGYVCTMAGRDAVTAECAEGEILIPDFMNLSWSCASLSDGYRCPGDLSIACPDEPVDPSAESCQCDGQLLVNPSCQTV